MNQFSFLFSPMAQAFGTTLLYSLWQAFIVFFFLKLILRFVPNTTAKFRYAVFCLSYVGIAVWSAVTFIQQLSIRQSELLFRKIAEQNSVTQFSVPYHPGHTFGDFSLSLFDNYLPWLTAIYLAGVVCFFIKLMWSYFLTIRLRTEGLTEMDSAFMDRLWLLATKMEVGKPVYAYISKYVVSPVVIGFFKPMILLPMAAINNLSPSQIETVLLHELAHVRRNDYLFNLFQTVLDILLFFNPFAYWISKNIRAEREISCDEMVLQLSDRYQYAKALLTLEESGQNNHRLAMGTNSKSSPLLTRIKNIMEMKNTHINLKQKLIALTIVVAATVSIAWLTPNENKNSHPGNNSKDLKSVSLTPINKTNPVFFEQISETKEIKDTNHPKMISPPPPPSAPVPPVAANLSVPPLPPLPPLPPVHPAAPNLVAPPPPPVPPLPRTDPGKYMVDTVPDVSNYFKNPDFQKQMDAINKSTEVIKKYFESDAWKNEQKLIQKSTAEIDDYFKSAEWQHQLEAIQKSTAAVGQYFNSDEWKKQQQEIEKNAEKTQEYFNSDEWKKQQKDIQKNAEKAQSYFNSDAWKKQQKEIQKSAEKAQSYFNSDEWKKQQKEIHKNAEKTQEFFKSDQWKKIQENLKHSMDSVRIKMNKDV